MLNRFHSLLFFIWADLAKFLCTSPDKASGKPMGFPPCFQQKGIAVVVLYPPSSKENGKKQRICWIYCKYVVLCFYSLKLRTTTNIIFSLLTKLSEKRDFLPRRESKTDQFLDGFEWKPTMPFGNFVSYAVTLKRYNYKRRHWRRTKLGL